jgi:hypothetical protein
MELVVDVNCCGFAFVFSVAFTTTTWGNSIVSWKLLAKNQDFKKENQTKFHYLGILCAY